MKRSAISQVSETGPKRSSPENLEVTHASGPSHMEDFATKVPVGEFVGEKEGESNRLSEKDASRDVLEEERELPTLATAEKVKTRARKRAGFTRKWQVEDIQGTSVDCHTTEESADFKICLCCAGLQPGVHRIH